MIWIYFINTIIYYNLKGCSFVFYRFQTAICTCVCVCVLARVVNRSPKFHQQ